MKKGARSLMTSVGRMSANRTAWGEGIKTVRPALLWFLFVRGSLCFRLYHAKCCRDGVTEGKDKNRLLVLCCCVLLTLWWMLLWFWRCDWHDGEREENHCSSIKCINALWGHSLDPSLILEGNNSVQWFMSSVYHLHLPQWKQGCSHSGCCCCCYLLPQSE